MVACRIHNFSWIQTSCNPTRQKVSPRLSLHSFGDDDSGGGNAIISQDLSRLTSFDNLFEPQESSSSDMEAAVKRFFSSPQFAVAGASGDPSKFGYKSELIACWRTFVHVLGASK
jgi:hypothetical protein